jgi:hypothetical protein
MDCGPAPDLPALSAACDRGDFASCFTAGVAAPGAAGSTERVETACRHAQTKACAIAGMRWIERHEFERAHDLFKLGCDGADGSACFNFLTMGMIAGFPDRFRLPSAEFAVVEAKTDALLRRECDRANASSCSALAQLLELVRLEDSVSERRTLYARACSGQVIDGCAHFFDPSDVGDTSTDVDLKAAITMLSCFCDHGVAKTCSLLEDARSLRKAMCDDGDKGDERETACRQLKLFPERAAQLR